MNYIHMAVLQLPSRAGDIEKVREELPRKENNKFKRCLIGFICILPACETFISHKPLKFEDKQNKIFIEHLHEMLVTP